MMLFHSFWMLFGFHSCFSLCFSFDNFYWPSFKFTTSILGCVVSANEPKRFFISVTVFFIWLFLRVLMSLWKCPSWLCLLPTFSRGVFSILLMAILIPCQILPTYVLPLNLVLLISLSLGTIFFFPFVCLIVFSWNQTSCEVETNVNSLVPGSRHAFLFAKPLAWRFAVRSWAGLEVCCCLLLLLL